MIRIIPAKPVTEFWIKQEFAKVGQEAVDWALRVVTCESNYNPYAKNGHSSATGLFQFLPGTFEANGKRDGMKSLQIYSWGQQIKIAANMFARGQKGEWECQ